LRYIILVVGCTSNNIKNRNYKLLHPLLFSNETLKAMVRNKLVLLLLESAIVLFFSCLI